VQRDLQTTNDLGYMKIKANFRSQCTRVYRYRVYSVIEGTVALLRYLFPVRYRFYGRLSDLNSGFPHGRRKDEFWSSAIGDDASLVDADDVKTTKRVDNTDLWYHEAAPPAYFALLE